jgi:hypothetical protein
MAIPRIAAAKIVVKSVRDFQSPRVLLHYALRTDSILISFCMSREVWLRCNRRVPAALAFLFALVLAASLIALLVGTSETGFWLSLAAGGASLAGMIRVFIRARRPRLAYANGMLAVYLAGAKPLAVPIDLVECFFMGQGPSLLPGALFGTPGRRFETANVIVRDVNPWLGAWCEVYITIRGTCCEPLHGELVAGLNRRLVEVRRSRAEDRQPAS